MTPRRFRSFHRDPADAVEDALYGALIHFADELRFAGLPDHLAWRAADKAMAAATDFLVRELPA